MDPIQATFAGGTPYVKFGSGRKTMLFLAEGPGNTVPSGMGASTDDYTILLVTRKSGLSEGGVQVADGRLPGCP